MGNCLIGKYTQNVDEKEEVMRESKRNDHRKVAGKKVKIILTRSELEKLILFQLSNDGVDGDGKMRSLGDLLRELEAERFVAEAAAAAMMEAEAPQGYGEWRPTLERIMESPEEDFS